MEERSIYLEKKKEFVEKLRKREEAQYLRKITWINTLIYISLILVIPPIVVIGYYYNIKFLYIIAGITLISGLIYTYINTVRCRKKIIRLTLEKVEDFFDKKYGTKKLSEEAEEEIFEKIEPYIYESNGDEHLTKITKDGKDILLISYMTAKYPYRGKVYYYYKFILVGKTTYDGVFYLKCRDKDIILNKNKMVFDKMFDTDYEININNGLLKKKEERTQKKYIQLSEGQKEKLLRIYNEYQEKFKIIIKDGYVFIEARKYIDNSFDSLEEIFDFQNCLNDLLLSLWDYFV